MTSMDTYRLSLANSLAEHGISRDMAYKAAECLSGYEKNAGIGDFFTDDDGNIRWSRILLPLGIAASVIGYKSGINGYRSRSAYENVKNYSLGALRGIIRNNSCNPLYDLDAVRDYSAAQAGDGK